MANVNAPNGFTPVGLLDGAAQTGGLFIRKIANADTNQIFMGDPVVSLSTGYITKATAGTTQIAGIFRGCRYVSSILKTTFASNWWSGSAANAVGDAIAYIDFNPNLLMEVQAASGPYTIADIGNNVQFALGTGNTTTGISGATATGSSATTSTLPFRIVGLVGVSDVPGIPGPYGSGGDATSAYNRILVTFNNQDFKALTGI